MASSHKVPPLLKNSASYNDWKKMVTVWKSFTPLEKNKQGGAILMTLEGAAQDTVLELEAADINSDEGIDKVIEKLDKLYTKDETLEKFEALETFDNFKRKHDTTIQEHIQQFEKLYNKLNYRASQPSVRKYVG